MPNEELATSKAVASALIRERLIFWSLGLYGIFSLGSMATMSIGAALVALALIIAWGPEKLIQILRQLSTTRSVREYGLLSVLLFLALLASLIGAWLAPLGFGGKSVVVHWGQDLAKTWYLVWPVILFAAIRSLRPEQKSQVIWLWMIALAVAGVVGVQEFFTGWPKNQGIPEAYPYYHATVFFGHHLSTASILIFPLFVALDVFRKGQTPFTARPLSTRARAFLACTIVLGLLCLIATYSRTLWVALPLGVLVWVMWNLPRRWILPAVFALFVVAVLANQIPQIHYRFFAVGGIGQRTDLWKENLLFLKERPLTGAGWHHNLELSGFYQGTFLPKDHVVFSGHAHNNLIEMLGGTGLLGTLAWLLWCFWVFKLTWGEARRRRVFGAGIFCAWVVFQINGLTQVNFWEAKVLHQMMWVLAWTMAGKDEAA